MTTKTVERDVAKAPAAYASFRLRGQRRRYSEYADGNRPRLTNTAMMA
jgi:hypothetical protein